MILHALPAADPQPPRREGRRRRAGFYANKNTAQAQTTPFQTPLDVESLIRATVGKIQGQGAAEADRPREAMRKAIAVLDAAVR